MNTLWTDFVNSEWHDWRGSGRSEDRLLKPEWQNDFLIQWQFSAPVPASAEDIEEMQILRRELRSFAEHLTSGGQMTSDLVDTINRKMIEGGPVTRLLKQEDEHFNIVLEPVANGWKKVLAEVVADFAQAFVNSGGSRIRICDNTDCRWVFYDDTRNRSKRFCDDKMCGNLMKVRRFRERKKN
ncbi:putative RNA-binding Zn ribbon-like protein [Paenibacillus sp. PvR133]|uniref:CGNR zinc finger domain-containing protein n=1 Tax=Paenibacillus sp. PvR133 TaxID=2806598 RepID=UPI001AE7B510|nr:CGNR zinc finger domain-containing protein [Paenibacillus sp. PvR133]MBP1176171.1 putative RNA-binding Zn ribbon-like protein [Paenibacillus sp. PvR133]